MNSLTGFGPVDTLRVELVLSELIGAQSTVMSAVMIQLTTYYTNSPLTFENIRYIETRKLHII